MSESPRETIRILYLVGGPGNAERVDVSDLFANHLAADGFEIDYVIFDNARTRAWERIDWRGAKAWAVGRSTLGGLAGAVVSKLYELWSDIRTSWLALTGNYDVIQIRDKFVVGVLALIAAKLRGRLFIYWMSYPFAESRIVDGREGNSRYPLFSLAGGHAAHSLLYKIILPFADFAFVQSEQMKQDVAAEGIDEKKMMPVPMAVDEGLLNEPVGPIEPNTILYLGTLVKVRRLDTLLESLQRVHERYPDATLVFVGDGDVPTDRGFLEERSRELGLESHVTFTGMLPMTEALAKVSRAAVCLSPFYPIPILLSTSPTKISEYMALGRPVVANAHPEQSLIIAESGGGICVEWSAEAFADAILTLLDDPESAEAMGRAGRRYVAGHRTYSVVAPTVAAKYRELVPTEGVHAADGGTS
jgi:glycosyltransferase involved in cell wall biosynthesis